jgi:hypothetical protein
MVKVMAKIFLVVTSAAYLHGWIINHSPTEASTTVFAVALLTRLSGGEVVELAEGSGFLLLRQVVKERGLAAALIRGQRWLAVLGLEPTEELAKAGWDENHGAQQDISGIQALSGDETTCSAPEARSLVIYPGPLLLCRNP